MPVPVACPRCQTKYSLGEEFQGKVLRCNHCQQPFKVGRLATPVQVACPACQAKYTLGEQFQGKVLRCNHCQQVFKVGTVARPNQPPPPVLPPVVPPRVAAPPASRTDPAPAPKLRPERGENSPHSPAGAGNGPSSRKRTLAWVAAVAAGVLLLTGSGSLTAWLLLKERREPIPPAASANGKQADEKAAGPTPVVPDKEVATPGKQPASDPSAPPTAESSPAAGATAGGTGGQLSGAVLKALKEATVFIKVDAGRLSATGSGFLVRVEGDSGFVVTNHHVVNPEAELLVPGRTARAEPRIVKVVPKSVAITVVFQSGTRGERTVPAEVLATDDSRDLAVLKVKGVADLPKSIDLGRKAELVETMPVYILGFPFGRSLSLKKGNPAITINKGSVSSLRENDFGQMKAVQIDGALNPGNSGGPVVDEQGRLVGIAVATIQGAGIGLAIAPDELNRLFDGRVGGVSFHTQKTSDDSAEVGVTLRFIDPLNQIKSAFLRYESGSVPLPPLKQKPDGSFDAMAGGQKLDLRVENQQATAQITLPTGGKNLVLINFQTCYVDGKGVTRHTQLSTHRLVVKGSPVAGQPPRAAPSADPVGGIQPAPVPTGGEERLLPSAVGAVCAGGGGRFLILHLPRERKLAVFDANEGRVVKYLPVAEDKALVAAGLDKLLVALPDSNVLERWSLATFEKEATVASPVSGVRALVMGSASREPLVIAATQAGRGDRCGLEFLDPQTFKKMDYEIDPGRDLGSGLGFGLDRHPPQLRISADGGVVTAWTPGISPSGLRSLVRLGKTYHNHYRHESVGYIAPSPDGRTLYTIGRQYTAEGQPRGQPAGVSDRAVCYLPALHGPYYLSIYETPPVGGRFRGSLQVSVHLPGNDRPLASLSNLAGLDSLTAWTNGKPPYEGQVFLIPDAKLLVIIPATNDKLILHRLDLEQLLVKSGVDYLFVQSQPVTQAARGAAYSYPVVVKSRKGGVKVKLDSGPPGMTVTAEGKLTWSVPADFAESETDVIVTVSDASGQEVLHTFKISVGDARP